MSNLFELENQILKLWQNRTFAKSLNFTIHTREQAMKAIANVNVVFSQNIFSIVIS